MHAIWLQNLGTQIDLEPVQGKSDLFLHTFPIQNKKEHNFISKGDTKLLSSEISTHSCSVLQVRMFVQIWG